jgi:hypothetical protein
VGRGTTRERESLTIFRLRPIFGLPLLRLLRGHLLPQGKKAAVALAAFLLLLSPSFADEPVDLELVLAIDASSSVDPTEWELQCEGYAAAFRDPEIQAAIISGPKKRVAIAVVVWADATVPRWDSNWFLLASPADSLGFAGFMENLPRIPEGGTGIGMGVAAAIRKLERNGFSSPREVVDVSGDGRETPPRENVVLMPMAHALAEARGVTVNGLAIIDEEDLSLETWYRDNVIAGRGSFVITIAGYSEFAEAIRRKLLREIQHQERVSQR